MINNKKFSMKSSLTFVFALGLFALVFFNEVAISQSVKGTITDENKQPISYATVYIEGLQTGTMANLNGLYEIMLKPGNYRLTFRSLGYKSVTKGVEVQNSSVTLNITLLTQSYMMKEVTITSDGEDLAYSVMRKAIAWSNYHLNQVQHYQSDIYLKGTFTIDKISKLMEKITTVDLNGQKFKLKSGQTFLMESTNEITFDAPNLYHQKVKSLQSTFPDNGSTQGSPMSYVQASFYDPNIMDCISPLSPQAFAHYKFVFEGFNQEDNFIIDKIKVIPRRASQQLFSGYLYIVEQQWCLHSVDLSNEQFWGKIRINQLYTPVKNDAWLPVSHNFHVDASMMGFTGAFNYVASVKYADIKINKNLTGPIPVVKEAKPIAETKKTKKEEAMEQLLAKDNLSFGDMRKLARAARKEEQKAKADTAKSHQIQNTQNYTFEKDATKHDSAYWSAYRPVPLTVQEIKSYHAKDSIKLSMKSDSTSNTKRKKSKPFKTLISGRRWFLGDSSVTVKYYGLLNPEFLSFNTVDGWMYNQKLGLTWNIDSTHSIFVSPKIGYAFNRKAWVGDIEGLVKYAPLSRGQFSFVAGHSFEDFNQESGINKHINSIASLFFRRNYVKLFDNKFINLKNEIDLANGLQFTVSGKYFESAYLDNHSDYSFFYRKARTYSSNVPNNGYFLLPLDSNYRSTNVTVGLKYTPGSYYRIVKGVKQMEQSKYPTFNLNYTGALSGVFGSNSSYQYINLGVDHHIALKNLASLNYSISYGKFFDVTRIHFSEYKHFNTQPLPVMVAGFEKSFQLLDYYKFSTSDQYFEGHIHYKSRLLLLKRLPIISKRIWTENLYLNYLTTPSLNNYVELGYGIGNIMALGNLGVFTSFENGKYQSVGVKVSIGLGK